MLITYRRTGGAFALLMLAAVAFVATVLAGVVVAAALIVAIAVGLAVLVGRALLPRSWRHRAVPGAAPRPGDTIEGTLVHATRSSNDDA